MRWLLNRRLAGLEIGAKALKLVIIEQKKNTWHFVHGATAPLPEGVVKPAFKSLNVTRPEVFIRAAQELVASYRGRIRMVGLSLPSEIIRVLLRGYPKLPDSHAETARFIKWNLEKSFHFPIAKTCVSFQPIGQDASGHENLLVTIGMKNVIQQFEMLLAGLGLDTRVVRPAGINLYNFLAPLIPPEGICAFLGLFNNYFNFLLFENNRLKFIQGIKRGFSDRQFIQDVDLTIQHYLDTNPGKRIGMLCIGSQVGYHDELREALGNLIDIQVIVLEEHTLINSPSDQRQPLERQKLSSWSSAIGAAQSIAGA